MICAERRKAESSLQQSCERIAFWPLSYRGWFRSGIILRYRTTGCCCQGGWLRRRRLAYLTHNFPDIIFDPFQKRPKLRGPTLDTVEIRLPLTGHRRALHFGVHDLNQPNPFVRGFETLALAQHVTTLEQHLDDGGAGCRRSQPGLLHRLGEFLLVESFACRLHGCEQCRLRETLRWPGLLFQGFDIHHILPLSAGKGRR